MWSRLKSSEIAARLVVGETGPELGLNQNAGLAILIDSGEIGPRAILADVLGAYLSDLSNFRAAGSHHL